MDLFTNKGDLFSSNYKKYNMKTPKGTRDLLPEEMSKFQFTIDVIRNVFERYGFLPLETPAFESFDLLASKSGLGEQVKDEIYYFKDKGDRELGLRFDLTVPLARVIANNPEIPKPFKRYQIGRVWRYDNPQAMRWREFWQADIDTIGTYSLRADAECLAAVAECLEKLNVKNFYIRVNNRKLLEEILIKLNVPKDKTLDVFRIIDKLDKIGLKGVKSELKKIVDSKIIDKINFKGTNQFIVKRIEKNFNNPGSLEEIRELFRYCDEYGIMKYIKLDLTLARGLEYYTGPVFEVMIGKEKVSIAGGGRYDRLIRTIGGPDLPATGISFGLDRLVSLIKIEKKKNNFFVIPVNKNLRYDAFKICKNLRSNGIIADMDLLNRNLSKQLKYASNNYRYVIIVGEKELKKKSVKIRDMKIGKEKLVKIKDLAKLNS